MKSLPDPIQRLIDHFSRLPGIGPKSAARLVFQLIHAPEEYIYDFSASLKGIKDEIAFCSRCHNICASGEELCAICADPSRLQDEILVVEDVLDLYAFERMGGYKGTYHVLGGLITPVSGIGPEQLNIASLLKRLKNLQSKVELIIATNPSLEGEATGMYIKDECMPMQHVSVTRLARGLPTGADLDYADNNTLERAFSGRSSF